MDYKKIQILIFSILLVLTVNAKAENEKECFEKVSRGIFEFNKGFRASS